MNQLPISIAFHGHPPADKPFACHVDGKPFNNFPENLYRGSHDDNMRDMVAHRKSHRLVENVGN